MARYKVLEKSFINDAVHEEGAIIEYTPPASTEVGSNLELLDKPKKGKAAEAEASTETSGDAIA
jgi:hypothetical protein